MKLEGSRARLRFAAAAALSLAGLAACACGADALDVATSTVELSVASTLAQDVASVFVSVEGPGIDGARSGLLSRSAGGPWRGALEGVPPGAERVVTVVAFDAAGLELCRRVSVGIETPANGSLELLVFLHDDASADPTRNDAPVIDTLLLAPSAVEPGGQVRVAVRAHDPDGEDVRVRWSAARGTFTAPDAAATTWTAPLVEGPCALTVEVGDDHGARHFVSVSVAVTVTARLGKVRVVASANHAPAITGMVAMPSIVAPGGAVTLALMAHDADGDPITFALDDDCGGVFARGRWIAPEIAPSSGRCLIHAVASDGRGGEGEGTLTVLVGADVTPNLSPIVEASFQSWDRFTQPGEPFTFEVTARDPDGDALSFSWSATSGTLGAVDTRGTTSGVTWTSGWSSATIRVHIRDARGAETIEEFHVAAPAAGG